MYQSKIINKSLGFRRPPNDCMSHCVNECVEGCESKCLLQQPKI